MSLAGYILSGDASTTLLSFMVGLDSIIFRRF